MRQDSKRKNKKISRSRIPGEFRWDIVSLYKSGKEWQKDCSKLDELLNRLSEFKHSFTEESGFFLEVLQLKDEILQLVQKIYTYAHMCKDEDNSNNLYQSFFYQASSLSVKAERSLSFIEPAILSLDYNKLKKWLQDKKNFQVYEHYLEKTCRKKEHTLTAGEEKIVAQTGDMSYMFEYSFELLSYADLSFPKIKDERGRIVPVTQSNFSTLLRDKNREVRKRAFKSYYKVYQKHRNIYAALLAGNIKKDQFYSSTRKYNNSLEAALFSEKIPREVYTGLLDFVHKKINLLHKYTQLKRDYLGLDQLHMYDIYAPLAEESSKIVYPEAQKIVLDSFKPLGDTYSAIVREAFQERWIDVYETKGKTSGAYSTGSYGSKPFILMNYQGTLEDVYTLAHELGHSVHSYLTNKNQPFIYSNIPIFLAEIASTTNEVLLTHYLLDKAKNKREKIVILNHFLEQFRTTFFRQVMFAEFELLIHQAQERGEAITADFLCQKYADLNHFYYGKDVIIDKEIHLEWARIPHFFYHYYVYQYATGFALAIALGQRILKEGIPVATRYIDFLKKGSSDYPLSVLKNIDINPVSNDYLDDALSQFSSLLEQFQNL